MNIKNTWLHNVTTVVIKDKVSIFVGMNYSGINIAL